MRVKTPLLILLMVLVPFLALADRDYKQQLNRYSTVSVSFSIAKKVKADRMRAVFIVIAKANNHSDALKSINGLTQRFKQFVIQKLQMAKFEVYPLAGKPRMATELIVLATPKVDSLPIIMKFISTSQKPPKIMIKPIAIRYALSPQARKKLQDALFEEALSVAKSRLRMTNRMLGSGYKIGKLSIFIIPAKKKMPHKGMMRKMQTPGKRSGFTKTAAKPPVTVAKKNVSKKGPKNLQGAGKMKRIAGMGKGKLMKMTKKYVGLKAWIRLKLVKKLEFD